jgi:FkbM family methyltransferase
VRRRVSTRASKPGTTLGRVRAALNLRIQQVLTRLGYEIRRWGPVKLLQIEGVTLVLDVGANIGQYARRLRYGGYERRIVSFEPLSGAYAELSRHAVSDPAWDAHRLALADNDGWAEINVSRKSTRSSLLEMCEHHVEIAPESAYVGKETAPTARLDSVWGDVVREGERVFLKMDVQGFELQVLHGAEAVIDGLHGVQSELSLVPLYAGAPSWREVVDWIEGRGFELAGLESAFMHRGRALQVDAIFLRARS